MKRAYFIVEGPHDVEVVGRLLGLRGFKRRRDFGGLDPYWVRLVPRTFPIDGDLLRRGPVPVFFDTADWSVAVHSALGVEAIGRTMRTSLLALGELPEGVGVLIDADHDVPTKVRWNAVRAMLPLPDCGVSPGSVGTGAPRVGIFVLPDNTRSGTLEDVLLACAERAYPSLLESARRLVDDLDPTDAITSRASRTEATSRNPRGGRRPSRVA